MKWDGMICNACAGVCNSMGFLLSTAKMERTILKCMLCIAWSATRDYLLPFISRCPLLCPPRWHRSHQSPSRSPSPSLCLKAPADLTSPLYRACFRNYPGHSSVSPTKIPSTRVQLLYSVFLPMKISLGYNPPACSLLADHPLKGRPSSLILHEPRGESRRRQILSQ